MTKKERILQYFTHGYMFCTIVGMLLLFSAHDFAIFFLGIGACSIPVSFGVFLAAHVGRFWGICAFLWTVLFPIVLLISYVYATKKKYGLFHLAIVLDSLISILFVVYTISETNWYGLKFAIADSIVSFSILYAFARVLRLPEA